MVPPAALSLVVLLGVLLASEVTAAQVPLPDVDVTLVVEIRDVAAWRAFHAEVLGTPQQALKGLEVAIAARTGGTRELTVVQPKFVASLFKGAAVFKVVVTGKVTAGEALGPLGAFEEAVVENQGQPGDSIVGLYYGLTSVAADLIEMHVSRP